MDTGCIPPTVNFFQYTSLTPKFSYCTLRKTWFEKIFILVREVKNSQTKTKKFRFQFFQKHKPKFRELRFVKYDPANEMKQ